MKIALFQSPVSEDRIRCDLCPQHCVMGEGEDGECRVRGVRSGTLQSLYYGMVSSGGLDPIEKKPLYHFFPGSEIFSIGGWGCNLTCAFCQNWSISQTARNSRAYDPPELAHAAAQSSSIGVAYTYNEPFVGYEFVLDCARAVREKGLKNVLVTNGFVEAQPASRLLPYIDALNIDIKSMDDSFYAEHCEGRLAPVLTLAMQAYNLGCHIEITNLIIPGLNDSPEQVATLAEWIANTLSPAVPLHLSAYRPEYRFAIERTTAAVLLRAREIACSHLDHVYLGNVATSAGSNTICPSCESCQITRAGYSTTVCGLDESGLCISCGAESGIVRK